MPRLRYATPEDVLRRFSGVTQLGEQTTPIADQIDNNEILGTEDDREVLESRIEAVESQWDREATPMRSVRVGSDHAPKYFDAKGTPWPVKCYLDHMNIAPFDASMGDFIETRTARDTYTDVTTQEGTAWVADYGDGVITVYKWPGRGQVPAFHDWQDRFVKLSYRIGAGGDFASAGETTIAESLTDSFTGTVDVSHADRLPRSDETLLIDGSEYVTVTDVDHDSDTIEILDRGKRFTATESHDEGTVIHFCPLNIRDAIAGYVAIDVSQHEEWSQALFDGDDQRSSKIGDWTDEWNRTVNAYSTASGYQ